MASALKCPMEDFGVVLRRYYVDMLAYHAVYSGTQPSFRTFSDAILCVTLSLSVRRVRQQRYRIMGHDSWRQSPNSSPIWGVDLQKDKYFKIICQSIFSLFDKLL